MKSMGKIIDAERFVKCLYDNADYFKKVNDGTYIVSESTFTKWNSYQSMPSMTHIKEINQLLPEKEQFDVIIVEELLLCVAMAQDHHRGKIRANLKAITSTAKKVFNMMVYGDLLESPKESVLTVRKDTSPELFSYLRSIGNNQNQVFYYLPCRTISKKQLYELGRKYKNKIKNSAFEGGLKNLVDNKLVEVVNETDELYKISFEGCKKFIQDNRI